MPIHGPLGGATAGGGGGGGIHFRDPADKFTSTTLALARTARNTFFGAAANKAALTEFQQDPYLAIIITDGTDEEVETYVGAVGAAYSATAWVTRTHAIQGKPGPVGPAPTAEQMRAAIGTLLNALPAFVYDSVADTITFTIPDDSVTADMAKAGNDADQGAWLTALNAASRDDLERVIQNLATAIDRVNAFDRARRSDNDIRDLAGALLAVLSEFSYDTNTHTLTFSGGGGGGGGITEDQARDAAGALLATLSQFTYDENTNTLTFSGGSGGGPAQITRVATQGNRPTASETATPVYVESETALYISVNRPHAATAAAGTFQRIVHRLDFQVVVVSPAPLPTADHYIYYVPDGEFYAGLVVSSSVTNWNQTTAAVALADSRSDASFDVVWLGKHATDAEALVHIPALAADTDYFYFNTTHGTIQRLDRSSYVAPGTLSDNWVWVRVDEDILDQLNTLNVTLSSQIGNAVQDAVQHTAVLLPVDDWMLDEQARTLRFTIVGLSPGDLNYQRVDKVRFTIGLGSYDVEWELADGRNLEFDMPTNDARAITENLVPGTDTDVRVNAFFHGTGGGAIGSDNLVASLSADIPVVRRNKLPRVLQAAVDGSDTAGVATITLPADYEDYHHLTIGVWGISNDRILETEFLTNLLAVQTANRNLTIGYQNNRNGAQATWNPTTRVLTSAGSPNHCRFIYVALED